MVGLRGVGKTVLLDRMRNDAEGSGIQTLRVEAPESRSLPAILAPQLRQALLRLSRDEQAKDLAQRALRALAGRAAVPARRVGPTRFRGGTLVPVVATLRFYAELNDFLPASRRQVAFVHHWDGRVSIKDLIEGLGVPHTAVDLLLANGEAVGFDYLVADGDRIAAYPVFESFDIAPVSRVRPEPLRDPRFVLDAHLGRLAAWLRLAGFDCLYRNDIGDAELAATAARERRAILTRDRGVLQRRAVTHGYLVRETNPERQLAEVVVRFDLRRFARPFSRCMRCNSPLDEVEKRAIARLVPARSREAFDQFQRCPGCSRIYWKGSHYGRLVRLLAGASVPVPDALQGRPSGRPVG